MNKATSSELSQISMNKGARIPDKVAPLTGPDKLQGIEIE